MSEHGQEELDLPKPPPGMFFRVFVPLNDEIVCVQLRQKRLIGSTRVDWFLADPDKKSIEGAAKVLVENQSYRWRNRQNAKYFSGDYHP